MIMRALVGTLVAVGLAIPGCTPTPDASTTGPTSTGDTSSSGTTTG